MFEAAAYYELQVSTLLHKLSQKGMIMIAEKDKNTILNLSKKYAISKVVLFGSSLVEQGGGSDIDIAVDGLSDRQFFSFYGELMFALSKPVDIVDLSKKSKFTAMVEKSGVRLDA